MDDVTPQLPLDLLDVLDDGVRTNTEGGADAPVDADEPIPFGLTARARRVVAPSSLPDLAVIDALTGAVAPVEDDPADTRPARARALRRAGASTVTIARELHADELLVRAWCAEITAPSGLRPVRHPATSGAASHDDATDLDLRADRVAWEAIRQRSRDEIELRLTDLDPLIAASAGVVVALAETTGYATTFETASPEAGRHAVEFLVNELEARRGEIRVVVRHGHELAGDRASDQWARDLGLDRGQVRSVRWYEAATPDHSLAMVRLPDREVAARVAAWRDVLFAHGSLTDPGAGVAF